MDIILRDNRYFLQLSNGELELTEQQARKRLERGDKLRESLQMPVTNPTPVSEQSFVSKESAEKNPAAFLVKNGFSLRADKQADVPPVVADPETIAANATRVQPEYTPHINGQAINAYGPGGQGQSIITSGKYFDNLIKEFEQIYEYSDDKDEAEEKLIRFCRNSITKLHHDRRNPKSDHIVIDFYILSWTRVLSHIRSLKLKEAVKAVEREQADELRVQALTPPPPLPKNVTRQILILQLMQADGLFPFSDALQGVTHQDIVHMMCGILNATESEVEDGILQSSSILLKRNVTTDNIQERIALLRDMELHFDKLPYHNIISRVKLLIRLYEDMAGEQ